MTSVVSVLGWMVVQVTIFTLASAALYLVMRRQSSATGSWILAGVLTMSLLVTAVALLPWPQSLHAINYFPPDEPTQSPSVAPRSTVSAPASASLAKSRPEMSSEVRSGAMHPAADEVGWVDPQQVFASTFIDALRGKRVGMPLQPDSSWGVFNWLAVVLMAGAALGLLRIAAAFRAVRRYHKVSRPVNDKALLELLDCVCAQLSATRQISVMECPHISSPATIGWRKPVILLPGDWRTLTSGELHAVIAHEVAHIQRADFLTWLVAQLSLAFHFYHPVMHWLVARLRVEQELAADCLAAGAVGGRVPYLTALAHIALREDDRAATWAARPFLSSRGTFIRRLSMLRDVKTPLGTRPPSRSTQATIMLALLLVGVVAAGIRPTANGVIAADEKSNTPEQSGLALDYLPEDPFIVIAARPAAIYENSTSTELKEELKELVDMLDMDLSLEDLAEVRIVATDDPAGKAAARTSPARPMRHDPFDRFILKSNKPTDWQGTINKLDLKVKKTTHDGKTYYAPASGNHAGLGYYTPDETTIVLATGEQLQQIIDEEDKQLVTDWSKQWTARSTAEVIYLQNLQDVNKLMDAASNASSALDLAGFAPLWKDGSFALTAVGREQQQLRTTVDVLSASDEAAVRIKRTLQAIVTLARNNLPQIKATLAADQGESGIQDAQSGLVELLEHLISDAKITLSDSMVEVQAQTGLPQAENAIALAVPAVRAAREAAYRAQSMNNLKQISVACYSYFDQNHVFPTASIVGPDGKTRHSWRVAILPYIGEDELFKQYRLDEPWDSENNKKLLSKMPAILRHPKVDARSTSPSYFLLTGAGTLSAAEQPDLIKVADGASITILAVEAEREIPWTKPEDVGISGDRPLPKFGGYSPDGFVVSFMDGSVRFLSSTVDEKVLRGLITIAGGETIDFSSL